MIRQVVIVGALGLGSLVVVPACSRQSSTASGDPGPVIAAPGVPPGPAPATAPTAPATQTFAGTFTGTIQGTPATLTAQQQGTRMSGTIDAGGYGYVLDGQVTGTRATGSMKDPQTGAALSFEATLRGDDLQLAFAIEGGAPMTLAFRRGGSARAAAAPPPTAPPPTAPPPPPAAPAPAAPVARAPAARAPAPAASVQRDPRMIGSWRYTEQLGDPSSGTMLIVWHLIVRPNGTFTYGNDRSEQNGQWRTEGSVVHVNDGSGWTPYARFTANGNQLLLTFADGSRRLWRRN